MRLLPLLPPLAAVIAGAVWLDSLAVSELSLGRSNAALRERIATAKAAGGAEIPVSVAELRTRSGHQAANGKMPSALLSEWKRLAESMLRADAGGEQDLRLNLRLQARLKRMSAAEILAELDDLTASDISREGLAALQSMLFNAAAGKDPQLALHHFESLLGETDHPLRGYLWNTFGHWLKQDPAIATAWLDEMTAAGKFETKRLDGKNEILNNCVGPLILSLLATDPAASLTRLKALPEDQRLELLMANVGNLTAGTVTAFANLVRQGLPEDQRTSGFCQYSNQIAAQRGLAKVGEFLNLIGASAEERQAVAGSAAAKGLAELLRRNGKVDELYDWLVQQTPQTADRDAGKALANSLRTAGFEKTAGMVAELHAKTGSDELLVGFLGDGSLDASTLRSHAEEATALAAQIKDDTLRDRMLTRIILATGPAPAGNDR